MIDISTFLCDEEIFNLLYKYGCGVRLNHLQKVAFYCNLLMDVLEERYELTSSDRSMTKYASLLHDIGYFINSSKHHKHSKYIVSSDVLLDKLPINERAILGLLVASHRKKLDDDLRFYPLEEQRKITKLISILRLADALDCNNGYVLDNIQIDGDIINLKLNEPMDKKHSKKFLLKSELFKDTFNLEINLSTT